MPAAAKLPAEHAEYVASASERYRDAYAGVARAVKDAFPKAQATKEFGMPAWRVKRPANAPMPATEGTMDPAFTFVGLVERASGLTLHFWYPGDYYFFEKYGNTLAGAGFKVMRGCLAFNRKQAFPVDVVERLLVAARDRDAAGAEPRAGGAKRAKPAKKARPAKGAKRGVAKRAK